MFGLSCESMEALQSVAVLDDSRQVKVGVIATSSETDASTSDARSDDDSVSVTSDSSSEYESLPEVMLP